MKNMKIVKELKQAILIYLARKKFIKELLKYKTIKIDKFLKIKINNETYLVRAEYWGYDNKNFFIDFYKNVKKNKIRIQRIYVSEDIILLIQNNTSGIIELDQVNLIHCYSI